jgi:hypothetical protein
MPPDPMMIERARGLSYIGPRKGCILAVMAEAFAQMGPGTVAARHWRTRRQRPYLTMRQAAIFCFGRKCMTPDDRWAFAQWPDEDSPVDVVCRQQRPDDTMHFEFVQLKEVVPAELNPDQTIQSVLDRLPQRYPRASGITIAINLNRDLTTPLDTLRMPALPGVSLWLFGQGGEPNDSFLFGDLLAAPMRCSFNYPRAYPGESPTRWTSLLDD